MGDEADDRWERIDSIFAQALDEPESTRDAFLDRVCGADEELASRVRELLTASSKATDYWENSGPRILKGLWGDVAQGQDPETDAAGQELGSYRLLQRLARGGMGSVYLAERADGRFEQKVAIKILRRGLDTEDVVRRFVAERRVLASLDHSHIAHLLDGGETPDGLPYLVMELVEGQPLTSHCDAARLPIPERVALFRQVAEAVQHAHRHLVIHRDLKPSNVLVTAGPDAQVKLLDFGIAKILDPDDHTSGGNTKTSARFMTPGYASPEQVVGREVTTASDVYQLGLLLYELLAGAHPFTVGSVPPLELERRIIEDDPIPPSRAVDEVSAGNRGSELERLRRRLGGDLDRVTMMALRKEPERRYTSVEQMLEDLDRIEKGLPVRAATQTLGYRARRFARRNRLAIAVGIAGTVLVTTYALTLTVQNSRVAAERDRAEREARKANQVSDFMVRLFEAANPEQTGGRELTVREVLDLGARQAGTDLADQPEVRAAVLSAVGRSYAGLGRYTDARTWLERALSARRAAHGDTAIAIAEDLRVLAQARLNWSDQMSLFEEALKVAEASVGANHPLVGKILADYGVLLSGLPERMEESVKLRERAVNILRRAPAEYRDDLAHALTVLAYSKPPAERVKEMKEALAIRREIHGGRHIAVSESLNDLALATEPLDPMAADSLMTEAVGILTEVFGEEHGRTLGGLNSLAALRRDRGAYAQAEETYRRVIAIRSRVYPHDPIPLAYSHYGLGLVLTELNRPEEGIGYLRQALALLMEGGIPDESPVVDFSRAAIGYALLKQGRLTEAETYLVPVAERVADRPGLTIDRARVLNWAARLYDASSRPKKAEQYRERVRTLEQGGAEPGKIG